MTRQVTGYDVLVLDAHTRGSLAIARSLGSAGLTLAAAGPAGSPLFRSRHVNSTLVLSNPDDAALDDYREPLVAWISEHRPKVVLTSTDGGVTALDALRDRMPEGVVLGIPGRAALAATADKEPTLAAGARVGLPAPAGVTVRDLDEAEKAAGDVGYPLVVKPTTSWRPVDGDGTSHGERVAARLVHDGSELEEAVRDLVRPDAPALVQEYATGRRLAVSLVRGAGCTWGAVAVEARRCWPSLGGNSVMRETVPMPQDLLRRSEALLDELGYEGYAEVEFRETSDGRPLLMEINPRFSQSVEVACRAGLDLPGLQVALSLGAAPPSTPATYTVGVRLSWLRGELNILQAALLGGASPRPPAGATLRAVARDLLPPTHFDTMSWSDPRPTLASLWGFVREMLRKARR